MIRITLTFEEKADVDYALTELENSLNHIGVDYGFYTDDTYLQAKFGQELGEKNGT